MKSVCVFIHIHKVYVPPLPGKYVTFDIIQSGREDVTEKKIFEEKGV